MYTQTCLIRRRNCRILHYKVEKTPVNKKNSSKVKTLTEIDYVWAPLLHNILLYFFFNGNN